MKKNFVSALASVLMGIFGNEAPNGKVANVPSMNEEKAKMYRNAKPMELADVLMPRFVMGPDDFGIRWINSGHFDRNARMRRSQRYNHHKK